jgi:hypothetical protein
MLFETDTTTKQVLAMYGIWFAFILVLLAVLFKRNRH